MATMHYWKQRALELRSENIHLKSENERLKRLVEFNKIVTTNKEESAVPIRGAEEEIAPTARDWYSDEKDEAQDWRRREAMKANKNLHPADTAKSGW